MFARVLSVIAALLFVAVEACAQPVTVIGPVTPGNVPVFNSPTVIKDSGSPPGGGVSCGGHAVGSFPVFNGASFQCSDVAGSTGLVNAASAGALGFKVNGSVEIGSGTLGSLGPDFVPCTNSYCLEVADPNYINAGSGVPYGAALQLNLAEKTFYAIGYDAGYAMFVAAKGTNRGPAYVWTATDDLHLMTSFNSFCIQGSPNCPEGPIASIPIHVSQNWVTFAQNAGPGPNATNATGVRVNPGSNPATFTGTISGTTLTASSVTGTIYPGQRITGPGIGGTPIYVVRQLTGSITGASFNGTIANPSGIPTLTVSGISGTIHLGDFVVGAPQFYTQIAGFGTGNGTTNGTYGITPMPLGCDPSTTCQTQGVATPMSTFIPGKDGTYLVSISVTVASSAMNAGFAVYNAGMGVAWNYRNTGETFLTNETSGHGAGTNDFIFADWNETTRTMTDLVKIVSPYNASQPGALVPLFGIGGVTDGTVAACAGCIGEYKSCTLGSAFQFSQTTWQNVCSISLGPGDWDVGGGIIYSVDGIGSLNAVNTYNLFGAAVALTNTGGSSGSLSFNEFSGYGQATFGQANLPGLPINPVQVACNSGGCNGTPSSTVFLNGFCFQASPAVSGGNPTACYAAFGPTTTRMWARRRR